MIEDYPALKVGRRTKFSKMQINDITDSKYTDTVLDDYNICQAKQDEFYMPIYFVPQSYTMFGNKINEAKIQNLFIPPFFDKVKRVKLEGSNLKNIKAIYLPSTLKEINGNLAYIISISQVEYLYLPPSISILPDFTFKDSDLKTIIIDAKVKEIPTFFCSLCKDLEQVVLNNYIEKINACAFEFNKINEIILPENLKEIGHSAFRACNLEEIEIPASVELIVERSFNGNPLKKIVFKSMNTNIEDKAFVTKTKYEVIVYGTKKEFKKWLKENKKKFNKDTIFTLKEEESFTLADFAKNALKIPAKF